MGCAGIGSLGCGGPADSGIVIVRLVVPTVVRWLRVCSPGRFTKGRSVGLGAGNQSAGEFAGIVL